MRQTSKRAEASGAVATTPDAGEVSLRPHPATPAVAGLVVHCAWAVRAGDLALRYALRGAVENLRWGTSAPDARQPPRRDRLWHHSCCELFAGVPGDAAYREFHFAPAPAWAAYGFDGPRLGMHPLPLPQPPQIACGQEAAQLWLTARLPWKVVAPTFPSAALEVGLSLILEDRDGARSFWAPDHPAPRPDFHDRRGWTLRLAAATANPRVRR